MKKLISFLLLAAMLITSAIAVIPASASTPEGTAVSTAAEFLAMDADGTYYLAADIELDSSYTKEFKGVLDGNGKTITLVPNATTAKAPYALMNNSSGCTIKNLTVEGDVTIPATDKQDLAGFVRWGWGTFENCVNKRNLTIEAVDTNAESHNNKIGGIICQAKGDSVFINCKNYGALSFNHLGTAKRAESGRVGGIVASCEAQTSQGAVQGGRGGTGTLIGCENFGPIVAKQLGMQIGGIIGGIQFGNYKLEDCVNHETGTVTYYQSYLAATGDTGGQSGVGGIIGATNLKLDTNALYMVNCRNDAKLTASDDVKAYGDADSAGLTKDIQIGGMLGRGYALKFVFMYNCVNAGDIYSPKKQTSWNATGGIIGSLATIGTQWDNLSSVDVTVSNCTNSGKLEGAQIGGIIGVQSQYKELATKVTIEYCTNLGDIVARNEYEKSVSACVAGGIFGTTITPSDGNKMANYTIKNCKNEGDITGISGAGGIVGKFSDPVVEHKSIVENCVVTGDVTLTTAAEGLTEKTTGAGGVIGVVDNSLKVYTIKNCYVTGKVTATNIEDAAFDADFINPIVPKLEAEKLDAATGNYYVDYDYTSVPSYATAEDVDNIEELIEAIVLKGTNTFNLTTTIKNIEGAYLSTDYTAASWAELTAKLTAAKAALEQREGADAQDAVDAAETALLAAAEALVFETPDLTELNKLIEDAKALLAMTDKYTSRTLGKLQDAIDATEVEGATDRKSGVAALVAEIKDRIESLEEKKNKDDKKDDDDDKKDDTAGGDDVAVTDAPAATDAPKKKGCGSAIGATAVVLTAVIALGTGVALKKKED